MTDLENKNKSYVACAKGILGKYERLKAELSTLSIEKFDPNKVFTCITADKAEISMKGYFADNLLSLKSKVKKETH